MKNIRWTGLAVLLTSAAGAYASSPVLQNGKYVPDADSPLCPQLVQTQLGDDGSLQSVTVSSYTAQCSFNMTLSCTDSSAGYNCSGSFTDPDGSVEPLTLNVLSATTYFYDDNGYTGTFSTDTSSPL